MPYAPDYRHQNSSTANQIYEDKQLLPEVSTLRSFLTFFNYDVSNIGQYLELIIIYRLLANITDLWLPQQK